MDNHSKDKIKKNRNFIYISAGCLLCILSMLPFFIMGEKSIITYNDQLDGELITYILNARHLFEGLDTYPELMNGIPAAGMISPAPLFIFLFKVFSPFVSFMIMMAVCRIAAFLSMYFLCSEFCEKKWIGFAVGIAFMMMPYYPVYGLCISGQAFVWYALVILSKDAPRMRHMLTAYALIVLYGLTSSPALVGFGIIGVFAIYAVFLVFKSIVKAFRVLAGTVLLLVTYALSNMPLVRQTLNIGYRFVSHKSETVVALRPAIDTVKTYFLGEDPYTACFQGIILVFSVLSVITALALSEKKDFAKEKKSIFNSILFIVSVIFLITVYSSPLLVGIRNNSTGMLHDFNFIRISWMLPPIWMLLLAQSSDFIIKCFEKKEKKKIALVFRVFSIAVIAVIFLMASFKNDSKTTTMRMIKGKEYKQISFGQFYSKELFDEAERVIGKDRTTIKVISMGLTPASAVYNNFNCLDAYSNNYDVNYKHEFREIIENELDKSDYYSDYFDDWGNRCYIYLAAYKTGINAYFYNITFNDIKVNFSKAKEMGADYVISASLINGWEDMGLKLLNEEPISSKDCWYELYVYEITG